MRRHSDVDGCQQIALTLSGHDSPTFDTQDASVRGSSRNLELDRFALERRNLDGRTERSLDKRDRHVHAHVVAVAFKHRMLTHRHGEHDVTRGSAILTLVAFAANADLLPVHCSGRNLNFDRSAGRAQAHGVTVDRLKEVDGHVRGDVLTLGRASPPAESTAGLTEA